MNILTETDIHQIRRATQEMLLSPQGRQWARPFLTERGKENGGNFTQLKREVLDILSDALSDLYTSPAPTQSR